MLLSKVNILYSVLLCQEFIKNYRRKGISPRVILKIDMAKAYDSLSCVFIENILHALGFPNQFVQWIMPLDNAVCHLHQILCSCE